MYQINNRENGMTKICSMEYTRESFAASLWGSGVSSPRVLEMMRRVPRHRFVSEALRYNAYKDISLPIGYGQTVSRPSVIARMVEALELRGHERVLEIGTGSGYQSAILAGLCGYLVTVERIGELRRRAEVLLNSMNYRNIGFIHSDDFNSARGSFDSIIVAAGTDLFPADIVYKLNEGGRLVIPVSNGSGHTIRKIVRMSNRDIITEDIGEATFVPYITEGVI